ncbi:MAG: 16S rRNA (guanine(966)-N(2))-methyltransferase RsmD [Bacilli bacterium]|nr:16S rRNA (guanine(966)-N(2))-methyltransferase RsmD [Bacilli bacterium]
MRIIGGKYRHRLISFPDDMAHTRPTKDRIREAVFSALGDINGFQVLDLYAGSGSMGIEAISRGAKHAIFVDISSLAIKTIKDNISNLNIDSSDYEIIKNNDLAAIESFKQRNLKFDLVVLDPPYEQGEYEKIVELLVDSNLLNENAIIVMETNRAITLENIDYQKNKEYHYGEITIYICWR